MRRRFKKIDTKSIMSEAGISFKVNSRGTGYKGLTCPHCGESDKFDMYMDSGASICYRGSCDWGRGRPFKDFLAATLDISKDEAHNLIYAKPTYKLDENEKPELSFDFDEDGEIYFNEDSETDESEDLGEISFPDPMFFKIDSHLSAKGLEYLQGRGVDLEIAKMLEIHFSAFSNRVIIPIKMNGKYYGWQGRHILNVSKSDRIRNSVGFKRDSMVMFLDNLLGNDDCIIAEGPFDAIKFYKAGGFVSTMGKYVSDKQLDLILKFNPRRVFLALDDDAMTETLELVKKIKTRSFDIKTYIVRVPKTCVDRCEILGKKADFGECSFDEALEAKESAEEVTGNSFIFI